MASKNEVKIGPRENPMEKARGPAAFAHEYRVVTGKGSEAQTKIRVWDIPAQCWKVVETVDAREGIALGTYALEAPPGAPAA